MRTFWTYILASRSRALYIGVTNDLARRLCEHRAGASAYTARYGIDRLVYAERFDSAWEAIAREKQLKSWTRARKVALIQGSNPTWRDLDASRYR